MSLSIGSIVSLPPSKLQEFCSTLSERDALFLRYHWEFWARPEQLPPDGDWFVWLIRAGRGFGKMSDVTDLIRTPEGWKALRDIQDGDRVFALDGRAYPVIKAHPIVTVPEAYKLIFDTGETIIADPDHLWYTISKIEEKRIRRGKATCGSVKTTQQIVGTLKYGGRETNHRVPVAQPLDLPEQDLPIHPYYLGVWLGDGDSAGSSITIEDQEVLDRIARLGYTVGAAYGRALNRYLVGNGSEPSRNAATGQFESNESLHSELRRLNLLRNKHIPPEYLNGSIQQRLDLLRGLMDSDGHCAKNGWCEFCATNTVLADNVSELVSGLGIKSRRYDGRAKLYGCDCGPRHRIVFKTVLTVFYLQRKVERQQRATSAQIIRHQNRYIVGAEKVTNVELRCLTVDSPDHLFLVGKALIATHNTRTGAEWVRQKVAAGYRRIALVGQTKADVRDTMIELGESSLLNVCPPWDRPVYEVTKRRVVWPNGAVAIAYSGDEPDQLRGPQHEASWVDELAKFKYPEETWSNLTLGLRIGPKPQICVTTTPRPIPIIKDLLQRPSTVDVRRPTYDNIANLSPVYIAEVIDPLKGTRLGRQEIEGEILDDNPDALWTRDMIERLRVREYPPLRRVVVAIDPAVTSRATSNETGIIAAGLGEDGHLYVLSDETLRASPHGWASQALTVYHSWDADRIVAEVNNGGEMVEHTIRTVEPMAPYRAVRASRGKRTRAEPIAALYEKGMAHHVGAFPDLEDQMCQWVPGEDSPDRLDALVWGATDLMLPKRQFAKVQMGRYA